MKENKYEVGDLVFIREGISGILLEYFKEECQAVITGSVIQPMIFEIFELRHNRLVVGHQKTANKTRFVVDCDKIRPATTTEVTLYGQSGKKESS